MSNAYPPNPQDPSAYGHDQQGYPQQDDGGRPYGQGQESGFATPRAYASWGQRVAARLIDSVILLPFLLFLVTGLMITGSNLETVTNADGSTTTSGDVDPLGLALVAAAFIVLFAFEFWNMVWRQGKTGQSLGKKVMNIMVVEERTGRPQGVGMTFVRYLAHYLDSLACDLGYLWPLWDAKRQTFADKIMNTVVVEAPKQ